MDETYRIRNYLRPVKKWFAIFTLFLVTLGSTYPCCLDDGCTNDPEDALSSEHSSGEKEEGFCSPFSVCSSCAVSVEMQALSMDVQELVPAQPFYNAFIVTDREGIYPSLFQPPRSC